MKKKKLKNGSGRHLVFQNQAKSYERHAFVDINILCKFGKFMLIKKGVMKSFIKRENRRMHARTFYNLLSQPIGQREIISCNV